MNTLRKLLYSTLAVLVLVSFVGCDSDDDDETTDADLFIGTWAATGVVDAEGNQTASFAQDVNSFTVTFVNNTEYDLNVDFADDRTDISVDNSTYSVSEANSTLSLTIPSPPAPQAINLPLGYTFSDNNDTVTLRVEGGLLQIVNTLFGADYTGFVEITLERQ